MNGPEVPKTTGYLLTESERRKLLIDWNKTHFEYPKGICLHQLFEAQVARAPDACAVVFEDQRLTFRELNGRANQLANYLRRLAVGPETRVGICMDRSLEMVIGLCGILKAGGAYVPIDPTYPQSRRDFMIHDAQVPVLLTHNRLKDLMPQSSARILCLDADWRTISDESTANVDSGVTENNLAYVIYTSGSTGNPKGAMIEHRSICNRLLWMQDTYALTGADRVLQKTSFSFDVSVWEFFWPLITGARLVMARPEGHKDTAYLVELICKERISVLHFVPSMLRAFLTDPAADRCNSVRQVICSGEALGFDLQQRFFARLTAKLDNLYGPTEAAVDVTFWRCRRNDRRGIVPIGRPVANTQIYILDADLEPVPVGSSGELYIGGVQVGRGYWNRPELTAEKFIRDPFSDDSEARLYKTGDLCRYLPDGNIEYLGRIDHQIKIRGFRVELDEIHAVLSEQAGVEDNVVVAREDESGHVSIVAYVVSRRTMPLGHNDVLEAHDAERVAQWKSVFDDVYRRREDAADVTFDLSGWHSSYTGLPIPDEEMQEWVQQTVDRVLARNPQKILEIGCGTGLLLYRLAPHCKEYVGTDLSKVALERISNWLDLPGNELSQAKLLHRPADNFQGTTEGSMDAVVLNSISQFFPSIDYFLGVLEKAVKSVRPGGFVYVGDVRNLHLLTAFHTSVELQRAPCTKTCSALWNRVQARVTEEEELVIAPEFFTALKAHLPAISHVDIQLRQGRHHNEMTRFRYDVFLHIGGQVGGSLEDVTLDWDQDRLTVGLLRARLDHEQPDSLGVARIPNGRLINVLSAVDALQRSRAAPDDTIAALQDLQAQTPDGGIDPQDIWDISRVLPYDVAITWSSTGELDRYDASFTRRGVCRETIRFANHHPETPRPWSDYANDPQHAMFNRSLKRSLRDVVANRLPEYMMPSAFVILDSLPLTANGKLDRAALPAPDAESRDVDSESAPPRNALERFLADQWCDVLGLQRVGISDNFFQVGGDSLTGALLINRLQERLGEFIYVATLVDCPTIAELADHLSEHYSSSIAAITGNEIRESTQANDAPVIDHRDIERVRCLVVSVAPVPHAPCNNRPAAFILSPPRSGSTLLRVMLAGHPRVFAPPELELLSFDTLSQRHAVFSGRNQFLLEGTIRSLMEIHGTSAESAKRMMEEYEHQKLSVRDFYGMLQDSIGEQLLVDKSPSAALDVQIMRRIESYFDRPKYVHLLRHPRGMIRSFERARLEHVFFHYKHPYTGRQLAELVWLLCQQNILAFLDAIPPERQFRLRYEDLVVDPQREMTRLCDFLAIDFHPSLLQPYDGSIRRMTSGIHSISRMLGDVRFHEHKGIDPRIAETWKDDEPKEPLATVTREVAVNLGYEDNNQGGTDATAVTEDARSSTIPRLGSEQEPVLSFAQERLWFLDQLYPASPVYNMPAAIRLRRPLDLDAFRRSIGEVIARHSSLRTTIQTIDSSPSLSTASRLEVDLPIIDLSSLDADEQARQMRQYVLDEATQPFDLSSGPLLRTRLLRLSDHEHIFLFTMHHIISDGWSMGVFVRDLAALYEAQQGQPAALPSLPVQYVDFAAWQRRRLVGKVRDELLAYWRNQLQNAPRQLDLPTDRPRPPIVSFAGDHYSFDIPSELYGKLRSFGHQEGTTLYVTLMAAFQTLLGHYSGQQQICVGTPTAGRNRAEFESLIGLFINTVVIYGDLRGNPKFRTLVSRTHETVKGALSHQDIPFEQLVQQLQGKRDLSRNPLFQVMFTFQNTTMRDSRFGESDWQPLSCEINASKFDLTLALTEGNDGLQGWWEYRTDLFDLSTIKTMASHFLELLQRIAMDPDQRINELLT